MMSVEKNIVPLDRLSGVARAKDFNLTALNETLSFLLEVMFTPKSSKLERRIAQAMFHPFAHVVVIPRHRPTLARSMKIDEFLSSDREAIKCENSWAETMRVQEPHWDSPFHEDIGAVRIRSIIAVDPQVTGMNTRNAEVLFVIGMVAGKQLIQSFTLVYDEMTASSRSPITLF